MLLCFSIVGLSNSELAWALTKRKQQNRSCPSVRLSVRYSFTATSQPPNLLTLIFYVHVWITARSSPGVKNQSRGSTFEIRASKVGLTSIEGSFSSDWLYVCSFWFWSQSWRCRVTVLGELLYFSWISVQHLTVYTMTFSCLGYSSTAQTLFLMKTYLSAAWLEHQPALLWRFCDGAVIQDLLTYLPYLLLPLLRYEMLF